MSILGTAVISRDLPPLRAWFYGVPKSGKTHLAKQFPRPLLISTDGNYIYETIPANAIKKWAVGPLAKKEDQAEAFVNVVQALVKDHSAYDTVIVDLADGAYELVREHYLGRLKIDHEQDIGYGKAYDIVNRHFWDAITQLFRLPINIIFISHEKTEIIKPKNKAEYTIFKPSLPDRYHQKLEGYCALVTRIYLDTNATGEEVRKMSLSPKESEYGITRFGNTTDIELTENGDNYGEFMKVWKALWEKRMAAGPKYVEPKNQARIEAEEAREAAKKEKALQEAKEAAAQAQEMIDKANEEKEVVKQETKKVESNIKPAVKKEVVKEEVKEEIDDGEPTIEQTDEVKAKMERLQKLKNANKAPKKTVTKKEPVVEEDDIGDGEPVIEQTDSVKAKMERILAIKAEKEAAAKKANK